MDESDPGPIGSTSEEAVLRRMEDPEYRRVILRQYRRQIYTLKEAAKTIEGLGIDLRVTWTEKSRLLVRIKKYDIAMRDLGIAAEALANVVLKQYLKTEPVPEPIDGAVRVLADAIVRAARVAIAAREDA